MEEPAVKTQNMVADKRNPGKTFIESIHGSEPTTKPAWANRV